PRLQAPDRSGPFLVTVFLAPYSGGLAVAHPGPGETAQSGFVDDPGPPVLLAPVELPGMRERPVFPPTSPISPEQDATHRSHATPHTRNTLHRVALIILPPARPSTDRRSSPSPA